MQDAISELKEILEAADEGKTIQCSGIQLYSPVVI
jgi:hypothetical protein